ncbi:UDP-N-acetylmuramoyl-tripeptide--D-alanyl-D-alanine ligase [Sphingobium sufflavum]|uniref:UDP-N-acetylmuramoyl-tripeptide--D-alanyl-D- alanine ligase n=1 Tax=Sphingobium sufflavum TaxID=1129547 RepID=UPI001F2C6D50|nr:UDP-N-acetylmuramoyl-tripeptide--D-alanyl-D-alanine ligase [Sphingobium sufflavum]MCE7795872.1 UDP-N-acetylmuramoyl-tripeptide--D-alanyl-D-alanine ligase [Sphingobium sufflavum]
MSALWTARTVAEATGGSMHGAFHAHGVAFDSREVGPGDLFVALKGTQSDGHDHVEKAFAAGAAAAVVERPVRGAHVRVADTTEALVALGCAARARTQAKVIGVTGSVGKTGTKEALWQALDRKAPNRAHRSVKSYNNHVGVPLSLARMPADSLFGIFEMGMNHEGELAALTRIVRPHVAIVTAIAPAHIGHFGGLEAIADAKAEIFEGLLPGGTAIIPADSPFAARLYNKAIRYADKVMTFGFSRDADVRVVDEVPARDGGTMVTARLPGGTINFHVAAPGRHWVSNALAIMAAVEAVGGDLAIAGLALAEMPGLPGRGERRRVAVEGGTILLIDESYNANPASMEATIGQLGREEAGRRIVVLGAMKELGDQSDALHAALAGPIGEAGISDAILIGEEMKPLAEALEGRLALRHVPDAQTAIDSLRPLLRADDVVLVKGSNSIGLSRVVAAIAGGTR